MNVKVPLRVLIFRIFRRVPSKRTFRGCPTRNTHHVSCQGPDTGAPALVRDEEDSVAETYNGYCVKCKEKRDFEGEVAVSKTGMKMAKGTCPVCGTTVNRILGKA
mgnify:CR=1 FL=1